MFFFNKIKEKKEIAVLAGLSVVFFFIYLFLYFGVEMRQSNHLIFNQPDESANYFFIRQLVLDNSFVYPEPLSFLSGNQVHPRSTTVINGQITPIGFPGMIFLSGFIIKFFLFFTGKWIFNFAAVSITPLAAAVTPLFLYGAARRVFGSYTGFASALLTYVHPAWWYYSSRPLQHNILFVFFTVLCLYWFSVFVESGKRRVLNASLTGLSLGLALYIRPSELIWLLFLFVILFALSIKKWRIQHVVGLFSALALVGILFFYTQTAYYGHPLGTGYAKPLSDGSSGLIVSNPQGISLIKAVVAPFGFHIKPILSNLYHYFWNLFRPWSFIAIAGLAVFAGITRKKENVTARRRLYIYTAVYAAVSLYIIVYYGSWSFFDNLSSAASIGSSHVRYFLPVYLGALPYAALLFKWLNKKKSLLMKSAFWMIGAGLLLGSYSSVFASFEGLYHVKDMVNKYYEYRGRIYSLAGDNAIIATRFGDKYIFPGRKIVSGFLDEEQYYSVKPLIENGFEVYFFEISMGQTSLDRISSSLDACGLSLSDPISSWDGLELRRLEKKSIVR